VASPAQISEAWLAAVDFRGNPEWPTGEGLLYRLDQDFEVTDLEERTEEDDSHFSARGTLTLTVRWFEDEGETIEASEGPFDLTISVGGEFTFVPGREERFVETWLTYNGAYLLWPYARAHIATITGLGRLPRLTIFTSQVPTAPDFESDEDASAITSPEP
jgi:hypothetical protein